MDYKEKYEMALEGIQEILGSGEDSIKMSRLQLRLQGIFPELKESDDEAESEDEKVRKVLIELISTFLRGHENGKIHGVYAKEMIDWLEKQGEQKGLDYPYVTGWRKNYKDNKPKVKHSVLMLTTHGIAEGEWLGEEWCQYRWSCKIKDEDVLYWLHLSDLENLEKENVEQKGTLCDTCRKAQPSHSCQDITALGRCALEKQGELKPVEIEPKFKVGDIIKHKKHGFTCKIIAVDTEYKLSDGFYLPFDFQDAYELVEQNSIECSEDNLPEFESYLCLMFQKFRIKYSTKGICTNGEIIDYVMEHAQKLKDTLCHAWSEEDELNLSEALHHIKMYNLADKADKLDKWLKSLKTRVQPQQPEWSDEDERQYRAAIAVCNSLGHNDTADWLKSLRPQSHWKPSDEQMDALRYVTNFDYGGHKATLVSLYEQLKKLGEK